MTKLDSVIKSRDITLPAKVCLVKVMVFSVVMHGFGAWTIKKAEWQRVDAFELWCWRGLLRVPWTARISNQSILKEISSWIFIGTAAAQAETPILWLPDAKSWLIGKTLILGKIEGRRRRGWQRMTWLDGITDSMDMGLGRLQELVMDRKAGILQTMGPQSRTWLEWLNWTDIHTTSHVYWL